MDLGPLYVAAIAGDTTAIVELKRKADKLNTYDRTILHIESMHGNAEHVKFILNKFANRNLLVKLDSNKETALHLAAYHGHTQVVKELLDAAKGLTTSADHDEAVSCYEAFVRQANRWMNTALHLAVSNGNVSIAKMLVEADRSERLVNDRKCDAPRGEHDHIIELITDNCITPSLNGPGTIIAVRPTLQDDDNDISREDHNEMHKAAVKCDMDEISYIFSIYEPIELHSMLREKDCDGNTPVHLLISTGCFVPEVITHQNADVLLKIKNNNGWSALDMLYFQEEIIGEQMKGVTVFCPDDWEASGMDATSYAAGNLKTCLEDLASHLF